MQHIAAIEAGIVASTGYATAAEYFASAEFAAAREAGWERWKLQDPDGGMYLNIFYSSCILFFFCFCSNSSFPFFFLL